MNDGPIPKKKVAAIILAAGKSSRLQRPKQLLPFRGKSLVRNVVQTAQFSNCQACVVVLGAFQTRVAREIKYFDVHLTRNLLWFKGMGSSLKHGIKFCEEELIGVDAYLIVLCDQPFIDEEYLNRLISEYHKGTHKIVASRLENSVGAPVLIDRCFREELMEIDDKIGARKFLKNHERDLLALDCPQGNFDVDTPEDYHKLQIFNRKNFVPGSSVEESL